HGQRKSFEFVLSEDQSGRPATAYHLVSPPRSGMHEPIGCGSHFESDCFGQLPGVGAPSCSPPSGSTFPLGTDPFSCHVTDNAGNNNSCSSVVKVQDTTPPVIASVSVTPSVVWPPNHKFVPVSLSVVAKDTCDPNPACTIVGITSSEPTNG